jgi:hypothetical protein
MRPGAMVIVEVRCEDAAQMALVEDDQVVQTLAAYRTDDPLDISILPGSARRSYDLDDAHRFDPSAEVCATRGVAIAQQIARSGVPRERFGYLL